MKCSLCNIDIPQERIDMGYTNVCVNCSTEEKKLGHIIYPHKTGAYIQVVDKETHDNLNRLDRRGYKSRTARHYKEFVVSKKNEDSDKTAERRCYRSSFTDNIIHISYDTALDMVMDYYNEWGYEKTLQYLRQMNSSGDIPLSTRVKIQDIITDRYLTPTPRALIRRFNKQMA